MQGTPEAVSVPFHPLERRVSIIVALLMSLRLLGLFLVLPILSLYVGQYPGATISGMAWVIGIYGLTQGLFQIPMGVLSDKIGRKPVIILGLLVFCIGSVLAARATTIDGLIAGRALQGAGAVGAVLLASLSDLTRQVVRPKAMALIGMSIGLSFSLGMFLGPVLEPWVGLSGLFWGTALAALGAMVLCALGMPRIAFQVKRVEWGAIRQVLRSKTLWCLNGSIFCSHAVFSASFLFIPSLLLERLSWSKESVWQVYLPILVFSVLLMMPFLRRSGDLPRVRGRLLGAVIVWMGCLAVLWYVEQPWVWALGLLGFFASFNLLEANLPSLVSAVVPPRVRGSALGIYSTSQFLGIFFGGVMSGLLHTQWGMDGVIGGLIFILAAYLILLRALDLPVYVVDRMLCFQALSLEACEKIRQELAACSSISEVSCLPEERVFYLRVSEPVVFERDIQLLEQGWKKRWPEELIKLF